MKIKVYEYKERSVVSDGMPGGPMLFTGPPDSYVRLEDVERLVKEAWKEAAEHPGIWWEHSNIVAQLRAMKGE